MLPGGAPSAVVAVDVDVATVRTLHVRRSNKDLVVDGFRIAPLKGPAARALGDACKEAMRLRLGDEPIAVCVASAEAAIRKIELPPMSASELREALPWEARRHIAGLAEDAIVDAQVLEAGNERTPMEVLLVAYPAASYAALESVFAALGIEPTFVDVRQLATLNAVADAGSPSTPIALLDLGAVSGMFAIFARSDLLLLRDLGQRVTHLNTLLHRQFGLDENGLDGLRATGKLPDGKTPAADELEGALAEVANELTEDIRSGLVFLENSTGASIDRVLLTGGSAALLDRQGISSVMAAHAGVNIERYHPFRSMRVGIVDELGLKSHDADFCAAVGVASRFFASRRG